MPDQLDTPDPGPLLELIEGFRRSQTLFAAVQLGIFDGARPDSPELGRLLDACVSLGLLEKSGNGYQNTALAEKFLRCSSPQSLAGYIRSAAEDSYPKWARLADALTGAKGIRQPSTRPEDEKQRVERRTRDFMSGLHGYGTISSPRVAAAFDLSRFRRFVDLGGSTGHLALAILERYPAMSVAVFDIPGVIQHAREYTGEKVQLYSGDLFVNELPPADLYALGKVLHNYAEDRVAILLKRVREALPSGGGLLVVERLMDEDRRGPVHVHLSSLNMLLSSQGRERTFSEYRTYLTQAGFRDIEMRKTGALVDAILAIKP